MATANSSSTRFSYTTWFWNLLLLQMFVVVVVGMMEFIGLLPLQRILLDWLGEFYRPTVYALLLFVPPDRPTLGDISLGLAPVGLGMVTYSLIGSTIGWMVSWCHRVLKTTKAS